ncbi:FKBP-type peptidyl-prolyl cis-trans isomerase [Bacteroidales bacterium OttesenSCG-928-M06]|nr:FKBP-type peptidyl-prolyl cis-trans isomerase [Bacteroidales bacterium OttesenSCG-928-M06]
MLKKYIYYFFAVLGSFLFVACNNDDDLVDEEWKSENEWAYNKIVTNQDTIEWTPIVDTPSGIPEGVYYNIIRRGGGKEKPFQTASVKALFKGYFYDGSVFSTNTSENATINVHDELPEVGEPNVIYILWEEDKYTTHIWLEGENMWQEGDFEIVSQDFRVNGMVPGFSIALQNMVVGDKWRVCIPYHLGYKTTGSSSSTGKVIVPGYSTLFFEIELLEINQYPSQV